MVPLFERSLRGLRPRRLILLEPVRRDVRRVGRGVGAYGAKRVCTVESAGSIRVTAQDLAPPLIEWIVGCGNETR